MAQDKYSKAEGTLLQPRVGGGWWVGEGRAETQHLESPAGGWPGARW